MKQSVLINIAYNQIGCFFPDQFRNILIVFGYHYINVFTVQHFYKASTLFPFFSNNKYPLHFIHILQWLLEEVLQQKNKFEFTLPLQRFTEQDSSLSSSV